MVKQMTVLLMLVIPAATCIGQTLFFENLKNSTWMSGEHLNDSVIRQAKDIKLTRVHSAMDSLTVNKTIWTFNDNLTVSYYNVATKKDSLISTYKYAIDKKKGILKIIPDDKVALAYKVGIVSTGNYALLVRNKKWEKGKE